MHHARRCSAALAALLAALLVLLAPVAAAQDEPADSVSIQPVMVQVVAPALADGARDLLPTIATAGTSVTLMLEPTGEERIVAVDHDASRIDRFGDDAGTDLLAAMDRPAAADRPAADHPLPPSNGERDAANDAPNDAGADPDPIAAPWLAPERGSPISRFPRVAGGGRWAAVDLAAPRVPAPGATALIIEGRLALRLAAGSREHRLDDVALEAGQTLAAPDADDRQEYAIEITRVRTVRWSDFELDVTLEMPTDTFRRLAEVRFYDGSGDRIASSAFAVQTMGPRAAAQYGLAEPLERATVELIFHDQLRDVELPVRLELSLGL